MVNNRETEIRDESLNLVVETYRAVNSLPNTINQATRYRLMDGCFSLSAKIAEVFKPAQNESSELTVTNALKKLIETINRVEKIEKKFELDPFIMERLHHLLEELRVELLFLLSELREINSETYSPKLAVVCI